jgi:hemerythrin-like domain-containing protein
MKRPRKSIRRSKFLPDPIAQLMQEHDETLRHLQRLNKASQALSEKGFTEDTFDQILSSLRFIHEEVNHHNLKEEEALFPVLERYVEGPTRIMRKDHRELYSQFRLLRTAVNKVHKNKKNPDAVRELANISRNVVQIFVNHIHKENYVLFPLVQRFLSKEELREVARRMV